jgi:hypothetical protein
VVEGWSGDGEPAGRSRLRLLAWVAGAVVVLAAVGATGGWLLASASGTDQSPSSASSPPPSSPSPSYLESSGPASESETGEFALPDVTGSDFADARRRLRDLKLGVQLVFGGIGDDRSVERTEPLAGAAVRPGVTVKLHVPGEPPSLTVPRLLGMTCAAAGRDAADRGFTPRYEPQKLGVVVRQEPEASAEAHWNDQVTLYCDGAAATSTP